MSTLSVRYQGVEIYDKVSVARCWHDMSAWGALDELAITFGDTDNLWDGWAPKDDDVIEVSDGAARTGKMYVRDVAPRSSAMDIRAYPVPHAMREAKCRSWESIRLHQLIAQVAQEAGMSYETYGLANSLYAYVEQRNESDLAFLSKRLTYEGASLIAFDGKLIAYSGAWAEAQSPVKRLEIAPGKDYEFEDFTARAYGSCLVTDGSTSATFTAGQGRQLKRVLDDRITDAAEASRFARGLLREANREVATIRLRTDTLLREWAPGSVLEIDAPAAASWDGKAFVSRLRHDYFDSRSKIWMTKMLGGY